jgi:NADH pyrophosphatase NudC (nudix superfamily)
MLRPTAELASGEIAIDEEELVDAAWFMPRRCRPFRNPDRPEADRRLARGRRGADAG